MFRSGTNLRLVTACLISILALFCVLADAYQYADGIRFAAGSSAAIDDDDSESDSKFLHTPALIEPPFEVSLSVVCSITSFTLFILTIKPTLDFTSLNSRAPPLL